MISVDCYHIDDPARHQVEVCERNATQLAAIDTGESDTGSFAWTTDESEGPRQDDQATIIRYCTSPEYHQPVIRPMRGGVEVRAPPLTSR